MFVFCFWRNSKVFLNAALKKSWWTDRENSPWKVSSSVFCSEGLPREAWSLLGRDVATMFSETSFQPLQGIKSINCPPDSKLFLMSNLILSCSNFSPLQSVLSAVAFTHLKIITMFPHSGFTCRWRTGLFQCFSGSESSPGFPLCSIHLVPGVPGIDALDWTWFSIWTKPSYWHFSRMVFAFLATWRRCWRMSSVWPLIPCMELLPSQSFPVLYFAQSVTPKCCTLCFSLVKCVPFFFNAHMHTHVHFCQVFSVSSAHPSEPKPCCLCSVGLAAFPSTASFAELIGALLILLCKSLTKILTNDKSGKYCRM